MSGLLEFSAARSGNNCIRRPSRAFRFLDPRGPSKLRRNHPSEVLTTCLARCAFNYGSTRTISTPWLGTNAEKLPAFSPGSLCAQKVAHLGGNMVRIAEIGPRDGDGRLGGGCARYSVPLIPPSASCFAHTSRPSVRFTLTALAAQR